MQKLSREQVLEIREVRKQGATLQALAELYGVSRRVIFYHTRDIKLPKSNGNRTVEWHSLDELSQWRPQMPWEGLLPVPVWFARLSGLDWHSIRGRIAGAHQAKPELDAPIEPEPSRDKNMPPV